MRLGPIENMTKEEILSAETLTEVFDEEDEIQRAVLIVQLSERAKD